MPSQTYLAGKLQGVFAAAQEDVVGEAVISSPIGGIVRRANRVQAETQKRQCPNCGSGSFNQEKVSI